MRFFALEQDLLGDNLQAEEFLSVLNMLADMADHFDDVLRKDLGGRSLRETLEAEQGAVDT
jgi:hypothetical protein